MDLITSHTHLDFDGLAAAVAARILYPESIISFPGPINPEVKDFISLYKDHLMLTKSSHVIRDEVKRLIIVDTRGDRRLGTFFSLVQKGIPLMIYDHHLEEGEEEDHPSSMALVGATTTLLLEEIQEKRFPITPFLATLFLLGIYADTGSLRYSTTTPRDTRVVTYLIESGGNLEVVDDFLQRPLTPEQQQLFNRLLEGGEQLEVAGITIHFFTTSCMLFVPGINRIVQELKNLTDARIVIILVAFEKGVAILGRSRGELMNLSSLFQKFGGGGHPGAAAAFVQGGNLVKVRKEILSLMQEEIEPTCTAKDIMSHPVYTIQPEQKMEEAEDLMLRFGHSGLIVIGEGRIQGIISRRDIDKGRRHNLLHAPVKAFMSSSVISISQDATIHEIQGLMMEHDIGRIPVLDTEGKLLGIVTRSDVLKSIYGHPIPRQGRHIYGSTRIPGQIRYHQLQDILDSLPSFTRDLLVQLGRLAHEIDSSLFLVGGFLRDLLLGQPSCDLDLVVEGDSRKFAQLLVTELDGEIIKETQLGTVELTISHDFHLDVAISRLEYYEESGSMPQVQFGTLEEDLYRRDFTINAMALSLNPKQWGVLIDFFQGISDLQEGRIRVLHNFSFIDDPLRILRGLRFAGRYGFLLEEHTRYLMETSLEEEILLKVSPSRLTNEILLIFKEENFLRILHLLEEFGLTSFFFHQPLRNRLPSFVGLEESLEEIQEMNKELVPDLWLLRLMILLSNKEEGELKSILKKLALPVNKERILLKIPKLLHIKDRFSQEITGSEIGELLAGLKDEEIFFLYHGEEEAPKERIQYYFETLSKVKSSLTGKDLLAMGLKGGPLIGEILSSLKKGRLDGRFSNSLEEKAYVMEYLTKNKKNKG